MPDGCGADTLANTLVTSLLNGEEFDIPDIDFEGDDFEIPDAGTIGEAIVRLTNADLTQVTLTGTGTFDVLMRAAALHLQKEYEANRITGEQYTKAYTALVESAMAQGVNFLIARDQAYWTAVTAQQNALAAQAQVITARVQLQTAKVQAYAVKFDAMNKKAEFALTKMKVSSESIGYCIAKYNLDNMLPKQLLLVTEQMEAQRAQTMDTRSNGATPVTGQIGKQKALYDQQIVSYQRDAEVKAAKIFSDAWITMKTIDEGLLPPDGFTNTSLDAILDTLKTNNELG